MSGPDSLLSRLTPCPTFKPVLFYDTAVHVTAPLVRVNQFSEKIFAQQLLEERKRSPFSVSEHKAYFVLWTYDINELVR